MTENGIPEMRITKKTYPVTTDVSLPQPHLSYAGKRRSFFNCSGWYPFTLAGVLAVALILCLALFGGKKVFLVAMDPFADLVPIVKQGELQVFPQMLSSHNGIESSYVTFLPPKNKTHFKHSLDELLAGYPNDHSDTYSNCWLQNPEADKPCFFDSSWITELCTSNDTYGYEETSGSYSPCFILKLANTGDWVPGFTRNRPGHQDSSFVPVHCFVKEFYRDRNETNSAVQLEVFPSKGISRQYFPVSTFDSDKYLAPLVAVKVSGIQEGEQVTVKCTIVTPNSFLLWNNGVAVIYFNPSKFIDDY